MTDTSIPIKSKLRDRLRARKRGNQTYSDVIRELLEIAEQQENTEQK